MTLFGEMYSRGLIRTWVRDRPSGWELASGKWSPFYFMFREVVSHPDLFEYSVACLTTLVHRQQQLSQIGLLVGVATTGIPLAAGVALRTSIPLAFTRKVAGVRTLDDLRQTTSAWGDHALVEGRLEDGTRYLLVDDVVTGGESKLLAKRQVEEEARRRGVQLEYAGTIVVVDRGSPGHEPSAFGVTAHHSFYHETRELLDFGASNWEIAVIRRYLEDPGAFQATTTRDLLMMALAKE